MKISILVFTILVTAAFTYSQAPCPGTPTVTYSGKTYNTVQIGTQCWLKENLDVGTIIKGNTNQTNNSSIEKYCYNDDVNNCNTYGGLYQWAEVMQYVKSEGAKGICPSGWHIPTYAEFKTTLGAALSYNFNALKAVGQGSGNGAGTNSSGFSALLAGYCNYNSYFGNLGFNTFFWSSSEYNTNGAYGMGLYYYDSDLSFYDYNKGNGLSVRCLKDVSTDILGETELPYTYSLSQNYPNPFNPTTTISYQLSAFSHVILKVYDILGVEVATLINDSKPAGEYSVEFNASYFSSGIYFYTIQAGNYTQTKQMVLIK